ncbi:MAG: hypothetical protein AAF821_02730 [Cyanobacteria bacterium P01_D01_bin.156]
MGAFKFKQLSQQGLLILAGMTLLGGLKAVSDFGSVADAVVSQPTVETQSSSEFSICSQAVDWQRPSLDQQQKQLTTNERYGGLLEDKAFQQLANQFWQYEILSFTTYGLSARMEPINLSGLWSVADDVWNQCYAHDEGSAINDGTLAEAWLMNHQVVDLQWQDNRYIMTVEPRARGMQVVQFTRREQASELPLTIVTSQGNSVNHYDADW